MIYAISMQDGTFVKVGYTSGKTADARIATLQTSSPFQLSLMFTVDGSLMQEQALHGSLRVAFHRIRIPIPGNEWYPGKHPFMRAFLAELEKSGPRGGLAHTEKYNPAVRQFGTGQKFAEKNRLRQVQECW